MPTELLTNDAPPDSQALPPTATPTEKEELRTGAQRQAKRVRRLKINVGAWLLGTILLTTLWVVNEWQAGGAFERFGNEGNPGDWSPTLWALGVGVWGLVVGIMALRVYFERPATESDVARSVERLKLQPTAGNAPTDAELRPFARARLVSVRRLKFHTAAWVLGMIVLTPLWALIEWQDNGGFERWSNNSQPGDWEPWILYIGAVWALVIAPLAARVLLGRPTTDDESDRVVSHVARGKEARR